MAFLYAEHTVKGKAYCGAQIQDSPNLLYHLSVSETSSEIRCDGLTKQCSKS